jgi:hypothetical protein
VSKSFKLKVVVGGASSYGKNTFLNKDYVVENEIGVSFNAVECLVNGEDSYKFILWELNPKDIFRFMYPNFCKGGRAALLFFDLGDANSFRELHYWITMVRKFSGDIPIILIGTEPEFGEIIIADEDIREIIKKHDLSEEYFTYLHYENKKRKKEDIFKYLIEQIDLKCTIQDFSILLPMDDKYFLEFLELFSNCPICKGKNHVSSLSKFFYSTSSEDIVLKSHLINLVEQAYFISKSRTNKINLNIGIPCCKCYKKLFENK